jgi:hypothetical protein
MFNIFKHSGYCMYHFLQHYKLRIISIQCIYTLCTVDHNKQQIFHKGHELLVCVTVTQCQTCAAF